MPLDVELQQALDGLSGETKRIVADLVTKNQELEKQQKDLQRQADAIDSRLQERHVGGETPTKTIGDEVVEHSEFIRAKELGFRGKFSFRLKGGVFPIERKSVITNTGLGFGTSGVLAPVHLPGVTGLAMQKLRLRDLLAVRKQDTGSAYDFARQTTRTNATSPQTEGAIKAESTYSWDVGSGRIRTIAHFTNVSRQALDDLPWLRGEIDGELTFGLKLKEEQEILSGDATGEHLNGIITQATSYDTGLNVASDTKLDKLRHAKLQARLAGLGTYEPDAYVVNPTDLHTIELIKDQASNVGNYVVGTPTGGLTAFKTLWGLPVVESDSIVAGTFLVGAFGTAATLIDRMETTVEISFEHDQNFVKNLATILAEERIGLAVRKPSAFIYGSY